MEKRVSAVPALLLMFLILLAVAPAFSSALPDSSTKVQGQACEMAHPFSYRYSFQYDRALEVGKSYELSMSFWISNSIVTINPYNVDVSLSPDGFELSERQFSLASGPKTITITPTKENAKISITARLALDGDDRRHPGYQAMYFDNFELSDFSIYPKGAVPEGELPEGAIDGTSSSSTTTVSDDKTINKTTATEGGMTTTDVEVERKAPSPAPWYIVRITGMIAYVLLSLSVIFGILRKLNPKKFGRLCSLHCDISYLALIFAFLHGINNIVDKYMWNLGLKDVFWVSFGAKNSNLISIGVIAFYIMLAVTISSVSPKIISFMKRKRWYALHLASYAAFLMVVLHSVLLGTDLDPTNLGDPLTLISSLIFWDFFAITAVLFFMLVFRDKKKPSADRKGTEEGSDKDDNGKETVEDGCEVPK